MQSAPLPTLLAATSLLLFPVLLAAQVPAATVRSDPTGFHLAGHLTGAAIVFEDDPAESGAGGGLTLGWGVSRLVTIFVQGSGASIDTEDGNDTYTLAHFDLGARFNFRGPQARALPYLAVAYSGRSAGIDLDGDLFTITGAGPSFGGGLALFFTPAVALDLGLLWTTGSFTEAEFQGQKETVDVSAVSTRFDLGLAWWVGD